MLVVLSQECRLGELEAKVSALDCQPFNLLLLEQQQRTNAKQHDNQRSDFQFSDHHTSRVVWPLSPLSPTLQMSDRSKNNQRGQLCKPASELQAPAPVRSIWFVRPTDCHG